MTDSAEIRDTWIAEANARGQTVAELRQILLLTVARLEAGEDAAVVVKETRRMMESVK